MTVAKAIQKNNLAFYFKNQERVHWCTYGQHPTARAYAVRVTEDPDDEVGHIVYACRRHYQATEEKL